MRRTWISGIIAAIILSSTMSLSSTAASNHVQFDAIQHEGETYVKASQVIDALGGSGEYDAERRIYQYTPSADVTEIVEMVSPSVVAVIGKPQDLAHFQASDRYALAHGSGVIVEQDGWIVTNAHVVDDMEQIVVVTSNEKQYIAEKKFVDVESDLALLKINANDLKPALFADSDRLKSGEPVAAIGTPISVSFRNSVTTGVISGMDRAADTMYRYLQTDAAINPGNSGGALVNMKGEVVGINTLKYVQTGVEGMGFSIPSNTVAYIMDHYFQYGEVRRATLGVGIEESWSAIVGLPQADPLTITTVTQGSNAARAGIKKGDKLFAIGDDDVRTIVDIHEVLKAYLPDDEVTLTLLSNGDLVNRTLKLEAMP